MTTSQLRKPDWMTELSGENLLTEEIIRKRAEKILAVKNIETLSIAAFFSALLPDSKCNRAVIKYKNVRIFYSPDTIIPVSAHFTLEEKVETLVVWLLKKLKTHGLLHDPHDTIKTTNPRPTYQDIVDLFVL